MLVPHRKYSWAIGDCSTSLETFHRIALQSCRHPDVLGRGHRLAKDLGAILVMAYSMTDSEFTTVEMIYKINRVLRSNAATRFM